MTKGQMEAKIIESAEKFEIDYMGRRPKQINTIIVKDLIIIRLESFLSQCEQKLAENIEGVEHVKKVRSSLFETAISYFESLIKQAIGVKIISIHSDVSTKTGEKVIIITVAENLDDMLQVN